MKRIMAIATAILMIAALSLSAFALEGSQDLVLCSQESATWSTHVSDRVTVNAAGEYTLTLSGLSFDASNLCTLYVKDADAVDVEVAGGTYDGSSGLTGVTILTKSIKINGTEVALTEGYPTAAKEDTGVIDICWYNTWDVNYFEAPAGTITDMEVVIEVVDGEGAAPAATETAAETETETAAAAPAAEAAPAATTAAAPNTGLGLAVVPAVMALAAVAVSKKH